MKQCFHHVLSILFLLSMGMGTVLAQSDPPSPPENRVHQKKNRAPKIKILRGKLDSLAKLEEVLEIWVENTEILNLEKAAQELEIKGHLNEAEDIYHDVIHAYQGVGDSLGLARVYNKVAELYNRERKYARARRYWRKASVASKEVAVVMPRIDFSSHDSLVEEIFISSPEEIGAMDIYSQQDPNLKFADEPTAPPVKPGPDNRFQDLVAELRQKESSRRKDSLTQALVLREQSQEIELLRQQQQIQSLELARQRADLQQEYIQQQAMILGLVFLLALAGLLIYLFFSKRRDHRKLGKAYEQLKSTQAQLVASEKMASLGQLTAGIAHEINNPINYVAGNVVPLKRDLKELRDAIERYQNELAKTMSQEEMDEMVKAMDLEFTLEEIDSLLSGIEEGAERTKEIVLGLRNFSRLDENDFKFADVHEGLDSTLTLLSHHLKAGIKIHKAYGLIPPIECLPGKLNQVFMNLMTNAVQAMGEEGDLYLGTQKMMQGKDPSFFPTHVKVSIRDNGAGIPKEALEKIFDPFFTTKEVGEGTGLGLSISYGIIQDHGGEIEVNSKLGSGTEFILKLPVAQAVSQES